MLRSRTPRPFPGPRAPVIYTSFPVLSSELLKNFPAVYINRRSVPLHKSTHATGLIPSQMKLVHTSTSYFIILHLNIIIPRVSKTMAKEVSIFVLTILYASAKFRKVTSSFVISVYLSIRPPRTTRLPLEGFSWNLIFEYFSKICRENSCFIKV
jgi:hypothetical protein